MMERIIDKFVTLRLSPQDLEDALGESETIRRLVVKNAINYQELPVRQQLINTALLKIKARGENVDKIPMIKAVRDVAKHNNIGAYEGLVEAKNLVEEYEETWRE
jgi:ribosomal protein L7/L12